MKTNCSTPFCLSVAFCMMAMSCSPSKKNEQSPPPKLSDPITNIQNSDDAKTNASGSAKIDFVQESPHGEIEQLQKLVIKVFDDVTLLRKEIEDEHCAILSLLSKAYVGLRTESGILLVACVGAEPYLNGHKLKLRIGNPLNANFRGFKIQCQYGLREPDHLPVDKIASDSEQMESIKRWVKASAKQSQSLRTMEASFTETLVSGAWNDVELILVPSTPEELGYIKISMATDVISLSLPKPK